MREGDGLPARRVYRTKAYRNAALFMGSFCLYCVARGATDPYFPAGRPAPPNPAPIRIVFVTIFACSAWLFFDRMLRGEVYPTRDGLRVRNIFRTFFIPWEEVQGVTLRRRRWFDPQPMAHVDRRDGTSVNDDSHSGKQPRSKGGSATGYRTECAAGFPRGEVSRDKWRRVARTNVGMGFQLRVTPRMFPGGSDVIAGEHTAQPVMALKQAFVGSAKVQQRRADVGRWSSDSSADSRSPSEGRADPGLGAAEAVALINFTPWFVGKIVIAHVGPKMRWMSSPGVVHAAVGEPIALSVRSVTCRLQAPRQLQAPTGITSEPKKTQVMPGIDRTLVYARLGLGGGSR